MRHRAFAAAMGLATAALFAPGSQSQAATADPTGYWMKPDAERESKIQVFKCGSSKKLLCAKIAWLKDPKDSKGKPLVDVRNENPSLRGRQIVGLTIFTGLTPSAPSTWTGKIYNPEDGKTYSATLTVLSRSKILLKGCKAWLLCGERYWLRTAAPEELQPTAPAEGTEQIEASVTPSAPEAPKAVAEAKPEPVEAELPGLPERAPDAPQAEIAAVAAPEAPAAPKEIAAAAAPAAPAEAQASHPVATPVALVTPAAAVPAPSAEYNWRKGYGFLNVATAPEPAKLSGENVPSMFVMAEPIAAEHGTPPAAEKGEATAALGEPVPAPAPKPKAKPKPMLANAAAKPSSKPAAAPKPASQAAPAPQEGETPEAATADSGEGQTAEAAMVDESTLTRRQRRLLRRQQMQQEPFLPWLR